ncbi:Pre-mRNA-processing-splicing factor 8 [Verticillium dahliae VDG1]|nr:Pre-mRNA-processing-splicing factor 8 [Verticillium dahliae VDG1]
MRVIWCPHPMLKKEYAGREPEVLAGRTGEAGDVDMHQVGELDDGWAEYLETLEGFPYAKYGIEVVKSD